MQVLVEDPDLGASLPADRRAEAERTLTAPVVTRKGRRWDAAADAELARGGIGLLLLDGMLTRRVGREQRWGVELLAAGDVLRPWQHDGAEATMPFETAWQVLVPLRMAVLDVEFAAALTAYPELVGEFVGRAMHRARSLATSMAITQYRRTSDRLLMLLWHLAERHGRVRPDGVLVEVPLTHELLADMIAVHRPSVSTTLSKLSDDGAVERVDRGWLLRTGPPGELGGEAVSAVRERHSDGEAG